jgi:peptide-methionine (R)-S-oxide reductase
MKTKIIIFSAVLLVGCTMATTAQQQDEKKNPYYKQNENAKLTVSDANWKKVLSPKVYDIMREKGTEAPDTGPYVHNYNKGTFYCASCGHALFSADTKFDRHT